MLRNQNSSNLALPKNNCDVYFPPSKPISTSLNPDAMSFIPKQKALMGFHVIIIIMVFILILLIIFIKILYGSGKVDMKDVSPKEKLRSLKIKSPNKRIIGHASVI